MIFLQEFRNRFQNLLGGYMTIVMDRDQVCGISKSDLSEAIRYSLRYRGEAEHRGAQVRIVEDKREN